MIQVPVVMRLYLHVPNLHLPETEWELAIIETSEKHKPRLVTKTAWVKSPTGVKSSLPRVYTPERNSNLPFQYVESMRNPRWHMSKAFLTRFFSVSIFTFEPGKFCCDLAGNCSLLTTSKPRLFSGVAFHDAQQ